MKIMIGYILFLCLLGAIAEPIRNSKLITNEVIQ